MEENGKTAEENGDLDEEIEKTEEPGFIERLSSRVYGLLGNPGVNSVILHLALIAVACICVYSNTLSVPFQWDDKDLVRDNRIVKDITYFIDPMKQAELAPFLRRYFGYLSFALNNAVGGMNVIGYHIVNIAIHLINGLLVYYLVILTFKTPYMTTPQQPDNGKPWDCELARYARLTAFLAAMLFIVHPIQTEAVTYIFQRFTSMMTTFFLLSFVLYIRWRLLPDDERHDKLFYLLSIISAVVAMKTKENALVLPLAVALYEFAFMRESKATSLSYLMPMLATFFIVPVSLLGVQRPIGEILSGLGPALRPYQQITNHDYLITEFKAHAVYLKLLFFPRGQNFAYDMSISKSMMDSGASFSFLLISAVLLAGVFTWKRFRLLSFGIFWYFIAHLVESSFISLPTVINEYRVYFPSVGIFIGVSALSFALFEKYRNSYKGLAVLVFAVVFLTALSATAYVRNGVWKTEVSLWEDVAEKSPGKVEAYNNLGIAYRFAGMNNRAIDSYKTAISYNALYEKAYYNLGVLLESLGEFDEAMKYLSTAVMLNPADADALMYIGNIYRKRGNLDSAIRYYEMAVDAQPDNENAYKNLDATTWELNQQKGSK